MTGLILIIFLQEIVGDEVETAFLETGAVGIILFRLSSQNVSELLIVRTGKPLFLIGVHLRIDLSTHIGGIFQSVVVFSSQTSIGRVSFLIIFGDGLNTTIVEIIVIGQLQGIAMMEKVIGMAQSVGILLEFGTTEESHTIERCLTGMLCETIQGDVQRLRILLQEIGCSGIVAEVVLRHAGGWHVVVGREGFVKVVTIEESTAKGFCIVIVTNCLCMLGVMMMATGVTTEAYNKHQTCQHDGGMSLGEYHDDIALLGYKDRNGFLTE